MLKEWHRKICCGLPLVLLNAMMFVALGHVKSALAADAIDFSKTPAAGEQVAQKLVLENLPAQAIQYWIYLPKNYTASDTSKKWPVMLFLHGAGESGSDLEKVKKHGPPKLVGTLPELEQFIVVSPQATETQRPVFERWDAGELLALVEHILKTTHSDKDRVYLTGLSMGGFGSWRLAAKQPTLFAAVVPICGGGKAEYAESLKSLPIWTFHGDADSVVPLKATTEMVEAIRAAGGQPKLTVYPGVGHDSWTTTYNNPELYKWLLEQHR
ncbi:phospholipase/Carboxylesterase [Planctopirus limnophila DSM 3776]|uniref:Phospholipase/Carboxylesterase n=1 Tax=Planctopirus limnophila (strain ATCC 43296 / DSM 3776 / IFAM 1008 / Mu 290) TaxID=521674 RepID=D5SN05_PLAL2|nr:prolyl oligopeptidase family serine peptidase [Planctopirus limnophila]ADG70038.1 phospholipase/Carboxylesterase [Planctopirus limnophila DSM 3776]